VLILSIAALMVLSIFPLRRAGKSLL